MKKRSRRQGNFKKKEEVFDSDDERAYKNIPIPDAHSSVYDEIDDFHKKQLKKLKKHLKKQEVASSEDEVEVLSLNSNDDIDYEAQLMEMQKQSHLEEVASDMGEEENSEDEHALPNDKAWGTRKKSFYHTDYVDDDLPGLSDEEEEQAEEEKEALAIQQRMANALDEEDFGMDLYKIDYKKDDDVDSRIVKDLSKLSKKEKLQHLQSDSPELFLLMNEFKSMVEELTGTLYPLMMLVKSGQIQNGPSLTYINTKFHLYLNYCINVSFYFALKSKQVSIRDHPILTRILSYKKLIQELKVLDEQLSDDINELLNDHKNGVINTEGSISNQVNGKHSKEYFSKGRKRSSDDSVPSGANKNKKNQLSLSVAEQAALEYYRTFEEKVQKRKQKQDPASEPVDEYEEEENSEDTKRAITYQISKNKGLTVKKKKEQRNPRVKHRMKFRRAKIRRKGQVREPTTEKQRYSGEASGIRASVIKSVKIQ